MSEHVRQHHVETFQGEDGDWYFRRVAANGEEVSRSSEGYDSQSNADRAARTGNPDLFGDFEQPEVAGQRQSSAEAVGDIG